VPPTVRSAELGLTVTDATGAGALALTVIVAEPLLPSLDAEMFADPVATPVTRPWLSTVATSDASLCHVIVACTWCPFESDATAVNCMVLETCTVPVDGVTTTTATGPVLPRGLTGNSHEKTTARAKPKRILDRPLIRANR
jgi:hypothetical protein